MIISNVISWHITGKNKFTMKMSNSESESPLCLHVNENKNIHEWDHVLEISMKSFVKKIYLHGILYYENVIQ